MYLWVERTSKLTRLVKIAHKRAENVERALIERLSPEKEFVHTLTADNGKEFSNHQRGSSQLEAGFYFAKPLLLMEEGFL